jgi:Tfp pilus assembly protein PilX
MTESLLTFLSRVRKLLGMAHKPMAWRTLKAPARLLCSEEGLSLVVVLVLICLLSLIGSFAMQRASVDVATSGNYKKSAQVLYIAEAGIEKARAELATKTVNQALAGADGKTGAGFDGDNGILSFGGSVSFGKGTYGVTVTDNNDGDNNQWVDVDGIFMVHSTGSMPDGSRRTIEVLLMKANAATPNFKATIMSRGPIDVNGNLDIDGRNYDTLGTLVNPADGIFAVSSRATFGMSGAAQVGGTSLSGINYPLSKSSATEQMVTEENATSWGNPATPDQFMGMTEGSLKTIAQSGLNGSQYVTNPGSLVFPLKGVTYVELPSGSTWQSMNFGASKGILVVHNSSTNAILKNTNGGTFKGIMIIDDLIHTHNDIFGAIITLTPNPSEGNVIGNGSGAVRYSKLAIQLALESIKQGVKVISWRELF